MGDDVPDRPPVVADIMGYCSALLCVLCFVALYLAPRGHIWLAAVAIGLASAANPLGVAFAAGLITWELIRIATSRSLNWGSVARLVGQGLVSVSGLIGYCLYLLIAFRDPLAFTKRRRAGRYRLASRRLSAASSVSNRCGVGSRAGRQRLMDRPSTSSSTPLWPSSSWPSSSP